MELRMHTSRACISSSGLGWKSQNGKKPLATHALLSSCGIIYKAKNTYDSHAGRSPVAAMERARQRARHGQHAGGVSGAAEASGGGGGAGDQALPNYPSTTAACHAALPPILSCVLPSLTAVCLSGQARVHRLPDPRPRLLRAGELGAAVERLQEREPADGGARADAGRGRGARAAHARRGAGPHLGGLCSHLEGARGIWQRLGCRCSPARVVVFQVKLLASPTLGLPLLADHKANTCGYHAGVAVMYTVPVGLCLYDHLLLWAYS